MIAFIDDQREGHGGGPICKVLPVAPSTCHDTVVKRADPATLSAGTRQDMVLKPEISRVFAGTSPQYGVRTVWRQMQREGFVIARCTVARLMQSLGLQGVIRGNPIETTDP